ncbi:MAG: hypothetical protein LBB68_06305, partial [Treponema sp.]|nr:hypothetical protein [Treponema sp.]
PSPGWCIPPVFTHEPVHHQRGLSGAKMAAAFFRISFASLSALTSFRRRVSPSVVRVRGRGANLSLRPPGTAVSTGVEHALVDAQIRRHLTHRLLMLLCQCRRFGLELLRVYPPFFVFRSPLFLSSWYISRVSLYPPVGVRSKAFF